MTPEVSSCFKIQQFRSFQDLSSNERAALLVSTIGGEQFVHSRNLEGKRAPARKKSGSLFHALVPKPRTHTLCGRVVLVFEWQMDLLDSLPSVLIIR